MKSHFAVRGHLKALTRLGFRAWRTKLADEKDARFQVLSDNRQARHNYFLMDPHTAQIVALRAHAIDEAGADLAHSSDDSVRSGEPHGQAERDALRCSFRRAADRHTGAGYSIDSSSGPAKDAACSQIAHQFAQAGHHGEIERARRVAADGRVASSLGAAALHPSDPDRAWPCGRSRPATDAVRRGGRRARPSRGFPPRGPGARRAWRRRGAPRAGHQAFGGALHFEQARRAIAVPRAVMAAARCGISRAGLAAACESPGRFRRCGRLAMLAVFQHVAPAGRAAATCAAAPGRARWDWPRARARPARCRTRAHGFLADERVVVDFGEALVHEDSRAPRAGTRSGLAGGTVVATSGAGGHDGIVTHHAADFFHQVVLHRNVFGGAPGGHGHRKHAGRGSPRRIQALQDVAHFRGARRRGPACAPASRGQSMGGGAAHLLALVRHAAHQADARRDFRSSSTARARPRTVLAGSCAFSKRMEASVRSLKAEEVLRTLRRGSWRFPARLRGLAADGAIRRRSRRRARWRRPRRRSPGCGIERVLSSFKARNIRLRRAADKMVSP
jgi:hypothetical protein